MTATNELRRMLTDAGVKYFGVDEHTTYCDGILDDTKWGLWRVFEYDGLLHIMFSDDGDFVTPQEAIAAIVGRGTCHIKEVASYGYSFECSECKAWYVVGALRGEFRFCPNCGRKVVDE